MERCSTRVTAYKDGRTFDECRRVARRIMPNIKARVEESGYISWDDALAISEYDTVVYKLVMKYMRQEGYDIGDNTTPQIRHRLS